MIIYYEELIDKYFDKVSKGIATKEEFDNYNKLIQWQLNSWKK